MKVIRFFILLLAIASTASAEVKNNLVSTGEFDNSRQSAVSLVQRPEYASMTITISSDEKELADQIQELSAATQTIEQAARVSAGTINVHRGQVLLSTEAKASRMKVSSYGIGSTAVVHLLYSLGEKKDVFEASRELALFASNLKPAGKASFRLSTIKLVVDNPEKYRSKLLQMIFEDLRQARLLARKSGKVVIVGLENPVLVRQTDDMQVELFIKYSVSMELPVEQ